MVISLSENVHVFMNKFKEVIGTSEKVFLRA